MSDIDYKEMTRAVQSIGVSAVLLSVLLSERGGREVRAQKQWRSVTGSREPSYVAGVYEPMAPAPRGTC